MKKKNNVPIYEEQALEQEEAVRPSLGKRIIKKVDSTLDMTLLTILLFFVAFGCYSMWDTNQVFSSADSAQYESYKPTADNTLSFDELRRINEDVFGWLTVYGTHIDYPILYYKNNDKYINTDVMGKYSMTGSIFLDYRNNPDFTDYNSIVYGHHMDQNAMFGEIGSFKNFEYFNERKYGDLFYDGESHGIEFFAFLEADAYDMTLYAPAIITPEAQQQYLQYILEHAMHKRDVNLQEGERLILLSTCTSDSTNGRHILVGKITDQTYEDTFVEEEDEIIIGTFGKDSLREWLEQIPMWGWVLTVVLVMILVGVIYYIITRHGKSKGEVDDEHNDEE